MGLPLGAWDVPFGVRVLANGGLHRDSGAIQVLPLANVSAARCRLHLVRDLIALEQVGECGPVVSPIVEGVNLDICDKVVSAIAHLEDLDVVLGVRRSHLVLEEVVSLVELEIVLENLR